jgi:hypothetical protein
VTFAKPPRSELSINPTNLARLGQFEAKMADDTLKRGSRDSSLINISEDDEVRYWTAKFRVSKEELGHAVQRAGSIAKDVEAELQNRKRKAAGRVRSLPMKRIRHCRVR